VVQRQWKTRLFERLLMGGVLAVILAPLVATVLLSVFHSEGHSGGYRPWALSRPTLSSYRAAWNDDDAREAIENSLLLALAVGVPASLLAFVCSVSWWKAGVRNLLLVLLFCIVAVPGDVHSIGVLGLLKVFGLQESSLIVLWFSLVIWVLPFATAIMMVAVSQIPNNLIAASGDLGASRVTTLWRIVFGLTYPAIGSAALVGALMTLSDYVRGFYLGGGSLLLGRHLMKKMNSGSDPSTYALAGFTFLLGVLFLILAVMGGQRTAARLGLRAK
jgi:ABC-type spermidine/putrescine transport system permease subunit II